MVFAVRENRVQQMRRSFLGGKKPEAVTPKSHVDSAGLQSGSCERLPRKEV